MLSILTPAECAALDRASADRGIASLALMERAGWAVARAAVASAGGAYGRRAVVVCGKGSNAGDGLVAARWLDRWGLGVTAVLLSPPADLGVPARETFRRFAETGGRWLPFSARGLDRELARAHVAVDAIFGTGFRGVPEGEFREAIDSIVRSEVPTVAVDIPSGVDGETGSVPGPAIVADRTVTFGAYKPGLLFSPGAEHAGEIEVADIGFPPDLVRSDLHLVEREDVAALLRPRPFESHKRTSGAVLVVAGSRSMTGAAILAATSAYRSGAGLVTLAVPEGILPVVQSALTEATFLPLPETGAGTVAESAWPLLQERLGLVRSAAVGPGLTTDPSTSALVRRLVAESPVPLVVDADGLNAFEGRRAVLAERRSEAVLTPHAGEFGRLTGLPAGEIVADRVGHARKAAAEFHSVVLLKGSRTVVAQPDGSAMVSPTGGPFLATGGTGDVLTGTVAAFLARGLEGAQAATAAAYVHGLAGRWAAAGSGDGTTASDVLDELPAVLAALAGEPP